MGPMPIGEGGLQECRVHEAPWVLRTKRQKLSFRTQVSVRSISGTPTIGRSPCREWGGKTNNILGLPSRIPSYQGRTCQGPQGAHRGAVTGREGVPLQEGLLRARQEAWAQVFLGTARHEGQKPRVERAQLSGSPSRR